MNNYSMKWRVMLTVVWSYNSLHIWADSLLLCSYSGQLSFWSTGHYMIHHLKEATNQTCIINNGILLFTQNIDLCQFIRQQNSSHTLNIVSYVKYTFRNKKDHIFVAYMYSSSDHCPTLWIPKRTEQIWEK